MSLLKKILPIHILFLKSLTSWNRMLSCHSLLSISNRLSTWFIESTIEAGDSWAPGLSSFSLVDRNSTIIELQKSRMMEEAGLRPQDKNHIFFILKVKTTFWLDAQKDSLVVKREQVSPHGKWCQPTIGLLAKRNWGTDGSVSCSILSDSLWSHGL